MGNTMTFRWGIGAVMVYVAGGCTPLNDVPRLRRDAGDAVVVDQTQPEVGTDAVTDQGVADTGDAPEDRPDTGTDATMEAAVDVVMVDDRVDAGGVDVAADVVTVTDVVTDVVDAGGGRVTVVGTFVPSAVPSTNLRISGGFTWQGRVNNARIEGWLR